MSKMMMTKIYFKFKIYRKLKNHLNSLMPAWMGYFWAGCAIIGMIIGGLL